MALRAGYYGLKKKIIDDINTLITKFTDVVVIKSIGEGLTLDNSGELSADSTGLIDYSTTEQDTGMKWIDEKTIFQKSYNIGDATGTKQFIDTLGDDISDIIYCYGSWNYQLSSQNEYRPLPHFASNSTMVYPIIDRADSNKLYMMIGTAANTKDMKLTILYTKTNINNQKKGGKK